MSCDGHELHLAFVHDLSSGWLETDILCLQASEGDTIETKMSLLQGQLGIGDACTFRLIEKNVVSLLPPQKEELRKDAANALTDLIR